MSELESPTPERPAADVGMEREATSEPSSQPATESPLEAEPAAVESQPLADPIDPPDPVFAVLERLEDRLEESQRLLARQTEIAAALHAENQRLKAGELRRAQLPLVRDLIRVHDVLGQILDAAVESTAAADLQIARDSIVDALARSGIERTNAVAGDPLDQRVHNVVGVEPVDDPAADRTIADVVKIGFAWVEGTTIRAVDVRVCKHTPAARAFASPDCAQDAAAGP